MARAASVPIAFALSWAAAAAGCSLLVDTAGLSEPLDASVRDAASVEAGEGGVDAATDGPKGDGGADAADAATTAYRDAVLADAPILYLRLDETTGTVAKDSSGKGNDGVYRAGCTLGVKGALAAEGGTAVRFAGTSCAVEVRGIDFSGTSPFTLEAWTYHEGADAVFRHFINKDARPQTGREQWGVYLHTSNGLVFERYIADSVFACSTTAPANNAWSHIVATFDGSQLRLYVDGVLRDSKTDARPQAPKDVPLLIGASGGGGQWNGALDEVAIYPKALAPATVVRHYDLGRAP
ncbi:MAG: LamG domain-containing protein [Deltaproteobacteria bacterium]|nr:LamG domain-containing protein [Deltaproteobacteria bacterium]